MKKKIFAILTASCLLAGCGSQNLGPLEEKTTKLRDENHKFKSDIQDLKLEIKKEKTNITALEKDKNNIKNAKSNKKKLNHIKASSEYYQDVAKAIGDYNDIEDAVSKNKQNEKVQSKLTDITNKIDDAFTTYKSKIDKDKMNDEDKKKHKNITKLNKSLDSAMGDIRDGYNEKDKKKLKKGQTNLSKVSINNE